jgi:hypothetical protein
MLCIGRGKATTGVGLAMSPTLITPDAPTPEEACNICGMEKWNLGILTSGVAASSTGLASAVVSTVQVFRRKNLPVLVAIRTQGGGAVRCTGNG